MTLRLEVITRAESLAAHTGSWHALLERSSANEPTLTPHWLLTWWNVFGHFDGRSLRAGLLFDGGRLVAVIPLLWRRYWYRPGIPFRRLEFLASGEKEADEICSDYLNIVAERGREPEVARVLALSLESRRFGECDELMLPAMAADNVFTGLLRDELRARGFVVECQATSPSPYVPLPDSWDAYLASLSSSHRYHVRRSVRDFERWAGESVRFSAAESLEQVHAAFETLRSLHSERWSADGKHGVFLSKRFSAFHRKVMPLLHETGALDLLILEARGRPLAALYNIVHNDKVYFYQSGRVLDVPNGIRPGVVIHAYAIRRAIEQGRREYDFLAGASQYKLSLAPKTRDMILLRAVRPSLLENARRTTKQLASTARTLWPRRQPTAPAAENP